MSQGSVNGGMPAGESHEVINLHEITGGIRVDAETGEVHTPEVPGSEILTVAAENETAILNYVQQRGDRVAAAMRRLNSRRVTWANREASISSGEPNWPRMPETLTAQERQEADRVLQRDNRQKRALKARLA